MIHYALVFFVIALVAALLGFRGVAGMSAQIGYALLTVAVIVLVIVFLTNSSVPSLR